MIFYRIQKNTKKSNLIDFDFHHLNFMECRKIEDFFAFDCFYLFKCSMEILYFIDSGFFNK